MTIILVTAAPGGGKTLTTVGLMMQDALKQGRSLHTMGIPDLSLPHFPVPEVEQWTELRKSEEDPSLMLPYFKFPANALVVIDECQRVYRKRPSGSKVPDHVAALETHRHTGIDIVLLTQHPNKVDPEVLAVVGRHIHLRDVGVFGRWWYEWPEYTDPKQFKSCPVKKRFQLPKESFDLYTSSTKHIKPVRTFPPALKLVLVGSVVAALAISWMVHRINSQLHPTEAQASEASKSIQGKGANLAPGQIAQTEPKTGAAVIEDFIPPHPMHPELAPAYAGKLSINSVPQIVGCMEVKGGPCNCYTQQYTKVDVPPQMCRDWIKNPPFDPYRQPQQVAVTPSDVKPASAVPPASPPPAAAQAAAPPPPQPS